MRAIGKFLGRALLGLAVLGALLWLVGPYEPSPLTPNVDTSRIGANLDPYFAAVEAQYSDITPGTEKRVVWAGAAGAKTDWAVVYVHGFSATSEEIRPVPDRVAEALGANLIYTRLRGHGRSGAAMAEAKVQDWVNDVAEALTAARAVGERVLVISTSTGGTLMAAAAQDPEMIKDVAGSIFVSPNFGVNNGVAPLLTFPAARYWLPSLAGDTNTWEPRNDAQAQYWTTSYPSVAILPMAALVKKVVALDHGKADVPALFMFSDEDQVVVPEATRKVAGAWGGPVEIVNPELTENDDDSRHVIAGDITAPDQTEGAVQVMLGWVAKL